MRSTIFRSILFALMVSTFSAAPSLADGMVINPFGNLCEEHIDVLLTAEQAKVLETKNTIVLTQSQRAYLTALYPKSANVTSLYLEREPEGTCTCESVNVATLASPMVIEVPLRLLGRDIQAEIEEDEKWSKFRDAEREYKKNLANVSPGAKVAAAPFPPERNRSELVPGLCFLGLFRSACILGFFQIVLVAAVLGVLILRLRTGRKELHRNE